MSETDRIYLTGMMGSGKSTLGIRAAKALSRSFIDLDEVIESRTGQTVRKIFAAQGEDRFRSLESELLSELSTEQNVIIALGGGTLLDEKNQEIVLRTGTLVYLSLSEATLVSRLELLASERGQNRPLLEDVKLLRDGQTNANEITPDESIKQLLRARLPGFQRANLNVELEGCSVETGLKRLLDSIATVLE